MRRLVAVFALLFFFAPLLLWAGGVRARPFENRRMAEVPKLSQGWDVFDGATRFFVDRLPLREQAVKANTWTSVNVFDTTPDYAGNTTAGGNPTRDALPFGEPDQPAKPTPAQTPGANARTDTTVLKGQDGWLFLQGELVRACEEIVPWKEAMARYERMLSLIRDSGREAVLVIPPDKSTIYPEFLPDSFAEKDCYEAGRARTWAAIEGAGRKDVFGLRKAMLEAKAPPPEETYYAQDTHWDTKGATLAVKALLEHLGGPVQMRDSEIRKSRQKIIGDLAGLVGLSEELTSPYWVVKRIDADPRAETVKLGNAEMTTHFWPDDVGPAREGRTLFVHDSFGLSMIGPLSPFSREFSVVLWYGTPVDQLIEQIVTSDTVILEKVERDVNYLASDGGIVTPAFLDQLEAALAKAPRGKGAG